MNISSGSRCLLPDVADLDDKIRGELYTLGAKNVRRIFPYTEVAMRARRLSIRYHGDIEDHIVQC